MTPDRDIIRHWSKIGAHLGIPGPAARHLAMTAGLPYFKLGEKTVASTASRLDAWMQEKQRAITGKASTRRDQKVA